MKQPLQGSVSQTGHDAEFADLVEVVIDQIHAGQPVDLTAMLSEHPEMASRLRRLLPTLQAMAEVGQLEGSAADVRSSSPSLEGPQQGILGDFQILQELGRGGMGVVYEAQQISLRRRVALKILPFAAVMDPRQLARFKNEAQAAATLAGRNSRQSRRRVLTDLKTFGPMVLCSGQSSIVQAMDRRLHLANHSGGMVASKMDMEMEHPKNPAQPSGDERFQPRPRCSFWGLLKQTGSDWSRDKVPRLGAALAYYTVFSLPGILFISLAIAGVVFGADAAHGHIKGQLQDLLGDEGAKAVDEIIVAAQRPGKGLLASVVGLIVLFFAASGVFGELQDGLNTIWEVAPKGGRGVWGTIQDRFLSFAMVLGTGFLLLVSLMLSAALSALGKWAANILPGPESVLQVANQGISLAVMTVLFAMIFKILPDVEIRWRVVWIGAAATALFFTIGKFVLGLYLGRAAVGSAYGAAGSLVVVLVWVYYSAQILYLGAEFTQSYARMYGSRIRPTANATAVTERARAEQGLPASTKPPF